MQKKNFILSFLFVLGLFFLTGCHNSKTQLMNELAEDGNYHYQNSDLGFSLVLPPEFIYYQTQRINNDDYTNLEIFVPTADVSKQTEISGYAKPIVVSIFNKDYWETTDKNDWDTYQKVEERDNGIYTLKLWDEIPSDWEDKWDEDLVQNIIDNFLVD